MRAPERMLLLLALAAGAAAAQTTAPAGPVPDAALPEADVYRREVFQYQAGGRPDPFYPLLSGDEIGVRVQDLQLVGIVYSADPRASVATFVLPDTTQRVRLRVGQRLGSVTLLSVQPRRVQVREDEMGVSRVHTLELQRIRRPVPTGGQAQPAPAAPAQAPAQAPPPAPGGRP